jgi:hypothetical protein
VRGLAAGKTLAEITLAPGMGVYIERDILPAEYEPTEEDYKEHDLGVRYRNVVRDGRLAMTSGVITERDLEVFDLIDCIRDLPYDCRLLALPMITTWEEDGWALREFLIYATGLGK